MDINDSLKIGETIKFYRNLRKLTQKELAAGICTQAQVSKIEKGTVLPLSSTLFFISQKLGIKVSDLFKESAYTRYDYMKDLAFEIRKRTINREYSEVLKIIEDEDSSLILTTEMNQFLLWHKGICTAHVYEKYKESISMINEALQLTNQNGGYFSEREIEIVNSLAIVYDLYGKSNVSHKYYKKALKESTILPSLDPKIKARLLYGLAKVEKSLGNLEASINVSEEGRVWCIKNGILYLFGELLYQKGYCMLLLGNKDGAKYINQAIMTFELQGNQELAKLAKKNLETELVKIENTVNAEEYFHTLQKPPVPD